MVKLVPLLSVLLLVVTNVKHHATVVHNQTTALLVPLAHLVNLVPLVMMVLLVNLDKLVQLVFHSV